MTGKPVDSDALLRLAEWLPSLARELVSSGADADDLAQEAWLALQRNPVPGDATTRSWLAGIIRNLRLASRRATSRREQRERATRAPREVPTPEELLEKLELQRQLAALVAALPEPERTVVLLRYSEGMSAAEIARQLGIPAGTVRWRLKGAVDRLRERLDAAPGGRAKWMAVLLPWVPRPSEAAVWIAPGVALKVAGVSLAAAVIVVAVGGGASGTPPGAREETADAGRMIPVIAIAPSAPPAPVVTAPALIAEAERDALPLDTQGITLSERGQAKDFNQALVPVIRAALRSCGEQRPAQERQLLMMELQLVSTRDGYDFLDVRAAEDAGADVYVRRCMELAFPRHLVAGDGGLPEGRRYHLGYPLLFRGLAEDAGTETADETTER